MAINRLIAQAGNTTFTVLTAAAVRLKTAVLTTNATVATRSLQVKTATSGFFNVSTKTVTASLNNQDLLDREVAIPPGGSIQIVNGVAGDTFTITTEEGYA